MHFNLSPIGIRILTKNDKLIKVPVAELENENSHPRLATDDQAFSLFKKYTETVLARQKLNNSWVRNVPSSIERKPDFEWSLYSTPLPTEEDVTVPSRGWESYYDARMRLFDKDLKEFENEWKKLRNAWLEESKKRAQARQQSRGSKGAPKTKLKNYAYNFITSRI